MKNIVKFLGIAATTAAVLVGCSKPANIDGVAKKDAEQTNKMGFIYIGPIGDGGWTFEHDKGRLAVEKECDIETTYKESVPESPEVKEIMRNMIDQGCNIIAATSFGYMDHVVELSKEYPEVAFLHCSGYKNTENMGNYFGRMYEPRFLSGLVAGMKTKSNKIGYVGAFEIPEVIRGVNAFTLGVQAVNPEAKVYVRWTHTWYDPAKEKAAAEALLDEGCDVIAQHQDTAGPQQAAEERGQSSVGYNSDMSSTAPKANMTSPVWNWGTYYIKQVNAVKNGSWKPTKYWGGMNDNIVLLAPLTEIAPEGAQAKVDEYTAKIKDGSFVVFAGPLKNQEGTVVVEEGQAMTDGEMLSMNWFIKGVVGKTK